MPMDIASMVLAVRAGCAPRWLHPPRPGHCLCVSLGGFTWLVKYVAMHSCAHAMRGHCAPHATGLPLLPVVCLLVTMGMDMNEWLIAWIVLL